MTFEWTIYAEEKVAKMGLQAALDTTGNLRAVAEIARAAGAFVDAKPTEIGGRLQTHSGYNADLWALVVRDEKGEQVALACKGLVYRP